MKYLALLSGGKDSCYNLIHCLKNGHELIAVASLGPEPGKEELDSYLYQTVGQDAIGLVASALEVPLYRRVITGSAIDQSSEYGTRTRIAAVEGDETEDLYALLSNVKSLHPSVQGVSVGAILSNYQRVRVEHVCRRLGLTPLCYLWQRDQGSLLSEMIDAGVDAVIIKVAGIGLTTKHLGLSLVQMQPTLIKLNKQYGSHICGEGGEYETLTLDCPSFKRKIVLEEVEKIIHSDNDFATVAYLRIRKAHLAPKLETSCTVMIPPLLNDSFVTLSAAFHSRPDPAPQISASDNYRRIATRYSSKSRGLWVSIANVHLSEESCNTSLEMTIEEEVTKCFEIVKESLSQYNLQLSNCVTINIYLSSMDLFARVNAIYSTFFGTSPPARACVAVDLPSPVNARLDCIAFSERLPTDRYALHVQGLSYWAPANIGPYSQAVMVDERVFMSGQIGLIPSSLHLPSPRSLGLETALACQHVERVSKCVSETTGDWVGHAQLVVYWLSRLDHAMQVRQSILCHKLPQDEFACALFMVVKELPKGALVEKQVLIHSDRIRRVDPDDGTISLESRRPVFSEGQLTLPNGEIQWQKSEAHDASSACMVICIKGGDSSIISQYLRTIESFNFMLHHSISSRLFYAPSSQVSVLQHILPSPTTFIPCRQISTFTATDWDSVLCIITAK
ncbi:hypothetical protein APHAL10511_001951 [Amanita phalloides]|nr:hypothetical protein APHAL10511_001951 [Amanita phalloides]